MGQFDDSGQWSSATTAGSTTFTHTGVTTIGVGGIPIGSGPYLAYPLQSLLSDMLYPYIPPTFSSFAITGVSLLECGNMITGNKTFTWTKTNPANVTPLSLSISDVVLGAIETLISTTSPKVHDFTATPIEFDVIGNDVFTVDALDTHLNPLSLTYTVNWNWRLLIGEQAGAGNLNSAQILALAIVNQVNSSCFGTYHFPGAATYKTITCPVAWTQPTSFKDLSTGFNVPMQASYAVAVTNSFGQIENYNVWRTTNVINADIDIIVGV